MREEIFVEGVFANRIPKNCKFRRRDFCESMLRSKFYGILFLIQALKTDFVEFIFAFLVFTFTFGDLDDWAFFNQIHNTTTIKT